MLRLSHGKKADVALRGDDILFIPGSTGKKAPCAASKQLFKRNRHGHLAQALKRTLRQK